MSHPDLELFPVYRQITSLAVHDQLVAGVELVAANFRNLGFERGDFTAKGDILPQEGVYSEVSTQLSDKVSGAVLLVKDALTLKYPGLEWMAARGDDVEVNWILSRRLTIQRVDPEQPDVVLGSYVHDYPVQQSTSPMRWMDAREASEKAAKTFDTLPEFADYQARIVAGCRALAEQLEP